MSKQINCAHCGRLIYDSEFDGDYNPAFNICNCEEGRKAYHRTLIYHPEFDEDSIDWYGAYQEALGALMFYNPKLARDIDNKYKE